MFCYSCGAKCSIERYVYAYDTETGEPKVSEIPHCPNKKWYQLESHPETESDAYVYQ